MSVFEFVSKQFSSEGKLPLGDVVNIGDIDVLIFKIESDENIKIEFMKNNSIQNIKNINSRFIDIFVNGKMVIELTVKSTSNTIITVDVSNLLKGKNVNSIIVERYIDIYVENCVNSVVEIENPIRGFLDIEDVKNSNIKINNNIYPLLLKLKQIENQSLHIVCDEEPEDVVVIKNLH